MRKEEIAEKMNILGAFLGKRDIPELSREALEAKYGFSQADVMVLFGGSILCGGDVLAEAMKNQIAKKYIIVGGAGHTTEALRQKMHQAVPEIETVGLPEAEVFEQYLEKRYGLHADYLEKKSTNCGNNITYLKDLIEKEGIACRTMILSQDSSMQYRMDASVQKYMPGVQVINYAVYDAKVVVRDGELTYEKEIWGMWDIDRYLTLLLGDVQRVSDNEDGYGPKGKGYIVHVDVPDEVEKAFADLKKEFGDKVRVANPEYAGGTN